jgi:hypothetical protein
MADPRGASCASRKSYNLMGNGSLGLEVVGFGFFVFFVFRAFGRSFWTGTLKNALGVVITFWRDFFLGIQRHSLIIYVRDICMTSGT